MMIRRSRNNFIGRLCDEYDVVTANDLQTAIRRATFYKPDISILDLQMPPDKDSPAIGLRLLEYIKGHLSQLESLDHEFKQRSRNAQGVFRRRR